jgi:16S rRNA processing protein RimM
VSGSSEAARDRVILGRIVGVHGIRGWVKVQSWTRPVENILQFSDWYLARAEGGWEPVSVVSGRLQGKGLVCAIAGVEDRDMARERLVGRDIAVPREALPEPDSDEVYWSDLQGMTVETLEGVGLGTVDHLIETGANDVLVVNGDRERLIPFTDVVVEVDLAGRRLRVDWDPDF